MQIEAELAELAARTEYDPGGFIWMAFPWGVKGTVLETKQPRAWLLDVCESIRTKLLANKTRPENMWEVVSEAVASGHGIGKSAALAQLMLWAMATKRDTRGVVTANTDTQLRTKTWPELVKWHSLCLFKHWFNVTATALFRIGSEQTWHIHAIPWSQHNTEAFQGLHNEGIRLFIAYDEASGIVDNVWEVTEGALTDAGTQIVWLAFGNPTRARGRFRECFTKFRELWGARNVDSRTVEGINLARIAKWLRIYGENSQFFSVRVRGQFVEADANQLISLDWIAEARMRGQTAAGDGSQLRRRLSADIANGGANDTVYTVVDHYETQRIGRRQVKANYPHSVAVPEAASALENMWRAWTCDASRGDDIVVDANGVGAGTAGNLIKAQYPVIEYYGGEKSSNPARFRNRRVQSYLALRNDLRDGGLAFAPDFVEDEEAWEEVEQQLCSIKLKIGTERVEDLFTKDEMQRDGIDSPDRADSLAEQYATQYPTLTGAQTSAGGEASMMHVERSSFLEGFET